MFKLKVPLCLSHYSVTFSHNAYCKWHNRKYKRNITHTHIKETGNRFSIHKCARFQSVREDVLWVTSTPMGRPCFCCIVSLPMCWGCNIKSSVLCFFLFLFFRFCFSISSLVNKCLVSPRLNMEMVAVTCHNIELMTSWAPSQYKDRLIYVWWFPC